MNPKDDNRFQYAEPEQAADAADLATDEFALRAIVRKLLDMMALKLSKRP